MAPDTEPTDAELDAVMQAAARVVRERKRDSDAWLRQQLRDAVTQATGRASVDKPTDPLKCSLRRVGAFRFPMTYDPPSPADMLNLKRRLGLSSAQMAELFALAGGNQWRKYQGGAAPREVGLTMLFFAASRLTLSEEEMSRVLACMQEMGARVQLDPVPSPREPRTKRPSDPTGSA